MYENGGSLYYTQSLKNERFSCQSELKFCLLCYAIMYDLGQSRNYNLSSDPDLAGYLQVRHATSIRIFKNKAILIWSMVRGFAIYVYSLLQIIDYPLIQSLMVLHHNFLRFFQILTTYTPSIVNVSYKHPLRDPFIISQHLQEVPLKKCYIKILSVFL